MSLLDDMIKQREAKRKATIGRVVVFAIFLVILIIAMIKAYKRM